MHFVKNRCICIHISLTHWDQLTHICSNKLTIIGSDNGLLPGLYLAVIWISAEMLLIGHLEQISVKSLSKFIHLHWKNAFKNVVWKKWPFCLDLNVLIFAMPGPISNNTLWSFFFQDRAFQFGAVNIIFDINCDLGNNSKFLVLLLFFSFPNCAH